MTPNEKALFDGFSKLNKLGVKILITDADELGNMLPREIKSGKKISSLIITPCFGDSWMVEYNSRSIFEGNNFIHLEIGKTLTLALLAMLIWVAENKKEGLIWT